MKRRTDPLAQQYRIRAEHAQRCALEAWDRHCAEAQRIAETYMSNGAFYAGNIPGADWRAASEALKKH